MPAETQPNKILRGKGDGEALSREKFLARLSDAGEKRRSGGDQDAGNQDAGDAGEPGTDLETALADAGADLAGDGDTSTGDGDAGRSGDGAKPTTLKAAAERLGLSVEEMYELKIPIDDGGKAETLTLGALKDARSQVSDLETRTLAFEEEKTRQENELIRAKQELAELMRALPVGSIKKETLDGIRKRAKEHRDAEAERLLEAVPEWDDDEKKATDRAGMVEHLGEYGLPATALDANADHRWVKYMRDNWRRKVAVDAAMKKVRKDNATDRDATRRRAAKPKGKTITKPTEGRPLSPSKLRNAFSGLNS